MGETSEEKKHTFTEEHKAVQAKKPIDWKHTCKNIFAVILLIILVYLIGNAVFTLGH